MSDEQLAQFEQAILHLLPAWAAEIAAYRQQRETERRRWNNAKELAVWYRAWREWLIQSDRLDDNYVDDLHTAWKRIKQLRRRSLTRMLRCRATKTRYNVL
jgi:hypothetical protein